MPAKTEKQRRFMAAELARKKAGERTKTGMKLRELEDFVRTKPKSRPASRSSYGRR